MNDLLCLLTLGRMLKRDTRVRSEHFFSWITLHKGQLFTTVKHVALVSHWRITTKTSQGHKQYTSFLNYIEVMYWRERDC